MPSYLNLLPGDPAPHFRARTSHNPRYAFDTAAGRYLVLCFFASASDPVAQAALAAVREGRRVFDDSHAAFFGVSNDPQDEAQRRVAESLPGLRYFWDFDGAVGRMFGALPTEQEPGAGIPTRRIWVVLDPTMRVLAVVPMQGAADGNAAAVLKYVANLPPPARFAGFEIAAPILILPNVFEPELCNTLVSLYEAHGGTESGFMREVDGKTVAVHDYGHKRRRDYNIEDQALISTLQNRIQRRVVPEIMKVHQFRVSRMERYIVACYAAEDQAHFNAHRDNTTKGTAHRRFAVSINLNAEFEGGEVSFPEYGPRSYKPPAGGAVVFSCSLLHAVSTVTKGRRYAFLPFLYDEAAARMREANNKYLGEGVGAYAAGSGARAAAPAPVAAEEKTRS
jgi:peroxiredoxin/predicted 2-oxoglutarate/Fe(II)-dependent dioxygenase YbiX